MSHQRVTDALWAHAGYEAGSNPTFLISGRAGSDEMNFTNAAAPAFSFADVGIAVA